VYYRPLSNWGEYDLSSPPSGHVYGEVDGDILLIRAATRLVVDAVILGSLLN
jgi:Ni/Co efflux regulator RcnB